MNIIYKIHILAFFFTMNLFACEVVISNDTTQDITDALVLYFPYATPMYGNSSFLKVNTKDALESISLFNGILYASQEHYTNKQIANGSVECECIISDKISNKITRYRLNNFKIIDASTSKNDQLVISLDFENNFKFDNTKHNLTICIYDKNGNFLKDMQDELAHLEVMDCTQTTAKN